MGLISPAQVSDGTTADASDVNSPINTIANEFNGNIDNTNIKASAAIDGSKIADNSIDINGKASTWDGWIEVHDSWTYASATTVTVPSDATAKYSVGDKVKFVQTTTKYFYITAVAATTLTLNGGSDYTVANAAITSINYSKAATPLGFPQWFNYTPTFSGFTVGSGSVAGKFSMNAKTVLFRASFTYGAGSAVAASNVSFPVTSATISDAKAPVGDVVFNDSDSSHYYGTLFWASTTAAQLRTSVTIGGAGTYNRLDAISSSAPFVWASGDEVHAQGEYEAA